MQVLKCAQQLDTAARWGLAIASGLRQNEALGVQWQNIDLEAGTLHVVGQLQWHPWKHGCLDKHGDSTCGRTKAHLCPKRHGGGPYLAYWTKSVAGNRVITLPKQIVKQLRELKVRQLEQRLKLGNRWADPFGDLVFTMPDGRPVRTEFDNRAWHSLLDLSEVGRQMRLHGARFTAVTNMLEDGSNPQVIVKLMGWTTSQMLDVYGLPGIAAKRTVTDKLDKLWN